MDNLARDAMLALKAGMTYGKWKAMQEPVKIKKKTLPDGWIECKYCGKAFKPTRGCQKYCCMDCRNRAYAPKAREKQKRYRERKEGNE